MTYKYSIKDIGENSAKASGINVGISLKQAIEICKFIKHKKVSDAKKILNDSINEKKAIPYTRFNKDTGHKKGIGPGKYPNKASKEILSLLETAEANAQFKGLNTGNLVISHICSQKGPNTWRHGRQSRRKMKRAHVEVIVEEKSKSTGSKNTKSTTENTGPKPESKKEDMTKQKVSPEKAPVKDEKPGTSKTEEKPVIKPTWSDNKENENKVKPAPQVEKEIKPPEKRVESKPEPVKDVTSRVVSKPESKKIDKPVEKVKPSESQKKEEKVIKND